MNKELIETTLADMRPINGDPLANLQAERDAAVGWIEQLYVDRAAYAHRNTELRAERDALANRVTELSFAARATDYSNMNY